MANNVSPLPNYKIHKTNAVNNKEFILIRIYEGDNTPYYVQNDGRIYIRTNDITKELIDIATADYSKLLYDKQKTASKNRNYFTDRGISIKNDLFIRAESIKSDKTGSVVRIMPKLLNAKSVVKISIQPNNPNQPLTDPENLIEKVREYQSRNHSYSEFPANNDLIPISEGMACFLYGFNPTNYDYQAVFSQGLMIHEFSINPEHEDSDIYLDYLFGKFFVFLQSAQKFYKLFNYQGALEITLNLYEIRNQTLVNHTNATFTKRIKALQDSYDWVLYLDTNKLFDDNVLIELITIFAKKVYWDLGFSDFNKELLINSFKGTRLIS